MTNDARLPGQYFDQETNLHYNYFRDYDPTTGRYTESDPIGLDGGLNTYSYVFQNPIVKIDPLGLKDGCPTGMAPDENGICRPFSGRDNPCNHFSCAADLPFFIPPDNRSFSEQECDECIFTCGLSTLFYPAPLPLTPNTLITFTGANITGLGVCMLVCKECPAPELECR